MSAEAPGSSAAAFPAPTLVVGIGRLGLAVLERLGEDWMWLQQAGGDPTLRNLRLLHLRPVGTPDEWRAGEQASVRLARHVGNDDLPRLALDFVILRCLGLVRFRNGCYQVALPRDAGAVAVERSGLDESASGLAAGAPVVEGPTLRRRVVRRRYFDWLELAHDPVEAVDRLRVLSERVGELDLFVRPLVQRVREGQSPHVLLTCVSRCRALVAGRDPSPWAWLRARDLAGLEGPAQGWTVRPNWLVAEDGPLELVAPEPLPGWDAWRAASRAGTDGPAPDLLLRVPQPFRSGPDDLLSPLLPQDLLRVDWERSGWGATQATEGDALEFETLAASPFRLGLFDHAGGPGAQGGWDPRLPDRLAVLGAQLHRGLVRVWLDLQRTGSAAAASGPETARAGQAVRQSFDLLGELLVRPLVAAPSAAGVAAADGAASPAAAMGGEGVAAPSLRPRQDPWVDGPSLPERASGRLRGLSVASQPQGTELQRALEARLAALGLGDGHGLAPRSRPLLREIELVAPDVETDPPADGSAAGLLALRAALNEEARHLFHFTHLASYRAQPTRRPPRLTLFVVGDLGEPFVRRSVQTAVRVAHAELLRAYGPLFASYREGFDRSLAVVPILWSPEPADAFGGAHPDANQGEEAAIIDAVHGLRRWVESVPRGRRCVPQLLINSRVTDNAVLGLGEAAAQTRHFIAFQARQDLSRDEWLRRTAVGVRGDDLFASFACYEIGFPAERAREYLANRFARTCLGHLLEGGVAAPPPGPQPSWTPGPQLLAPLGPARDELQRAADALAEDLAADVDGAATVDGGAPAAALCAAYDDAFEETLRRKVHRRWSELTRSQGRMDDMVGALRAGAARELSRSLEAVRVHGDSLIADEASEGGLRSAQAGFHAVRAEARALLDERERGRAQAQAACMRHRIPETAPIGAARAAVVEHATRKPDQGPMLVGLLLWALLAPVLGAPLLQTVAVFLGLPQQPGPLEVALGPLAPALALPLLLLPVAWLLRRHLHKHVEAVRGAVRSLAEATRRVVTGDGLDPRDEAQPSVRSFFDARLLHSGALAARGFGLRVHAAARQQARLAQRISRSVGVQLQILRQRAEELGARSSPEAPTAGGVSDRIEGLFASRFGAGSALLVSPASLLPYYAKRVGHDADVGTALPTLLRDVGGLAEWRREACLADTEAILGVTRQAFRDLVDVPVSRQPSFADEAGQRLCTFVARHYPNMGFGAKFVGYEGLDPDGVRVLADATLVAHPELERLYRCARALPDAPSTTDTLRVRPCTQLNNVAYMFSLAQGIRPRSVHNLRRFESFHERDPDAAAAPPERSEEAGRVGTDVSAPVTPLGEELGRRLHESLVPTSRAIPGASSPPSERQP